MAEWPRIEIASHEPGVEADRVSKVDPKAPAADGRNVGPSRFGSSTPVVRDP